MRLGFLSGPGPGLSPMLCHGTPTRTRLMQVRMQPIHPFHIFFRVLSIRIGLVGEIQAGLPARRCRDSFRVVLVLLLIVF